MEIWDQRRNIHPLTLYTSTRKKSSANPSRGRNPPANTWVAFTSLKFLLSYKNIYPENIFILSFIERLHNQKIFFRKCKGLNYYQLKSLSRANLEIWDQRQNINPLALYHGLYKVFPANRFRGWNPPFNNWTVLMPLKILLSSKNNYFLNMFYTTS